MNKSRFFQLELKYKNLSFLTQSGNTGLQTIQSSNSDLRLFHIHCKWTKLAKFKNMSES